MGFWKRFLDWINNEGVSPDPLPDPEVVANITKKLLETAQSESGDPNMNEAVNIRVFSLSTCSHCKSTKKLLDECTVQYEFTDVDLLDRQERLLILDDLKKLNPRCSFPTIIIGQTVVVGYKEDQIREALGL